MKLALDNPSVVDLLPAWGVPYSYGAGAPVDAERCWPGGSKGIGGGVGWDCSGFVQCALVRMGMLSPIAKDRTAQSLYEFSIPVVGEPVVGDMTFYGGGPKTVTHVMLVVGDGCCMGSCGGTRFTNGSDEKAFVQIHRLRYRSDFLGVRRLLQAVSVPGA